MKKIALSVLTIGLLAFANCSNSAKTNGINLRLNLDKGQKFDVEVTMDQVIDTKTSGMDLNMKQTFIMDYTVSVADIKDTIYSLKNLYNRVYMKQSIPSLGAMGETEYDTKKPDDKKGIAAAAIGATFQNLIGASFTMDMTHRGNITNANYDDLIEKLGGGEAVKNALPKENATSYFASFPNKTLKIGDSWENELKSSGNMPMITKNTYTLKEIKKDVAIIEVKSLILTDTTSSDENIKSISGEQKGKMEIDTKTGWTKTVNIDQTIKIEMEQSGQAMPMNIKSKILVKSK